MRIFRRFIAAICCLVLATAAVSADESGVLERDFRTFLDWFPGVYDNAEQVFFEDELGVPEDERHERIHHTFARVVLPEFGEHVFYVQQYLDDEPSSIYRQRFYSFVLDHDENAIRLKVLTPKNTDAVVDAHLDPAKYQDLTMDDVTNVSGCDVFWQRRANQFAGYMKERACSFFSQRSGKRVFIDDDLLLSEEELWISDRAEDEEGNYVFGNKAGVPHKNRKARRFECWMAVRKQDGDSWSFDSDLEVWDQGGSAWVTTDEPESQTVGIKMRNVVWPTGTNRNSLVLYAYRQGDDRAVSYAWGAPDATSLGINLRWMQASCRQVD